MDGVGRGLFGVLVSIAPSQCFSNACRLEPEDYHGHYGLAEACWENNRVADAAPAMTAALRLMQTDPAVTKPEVWTAERFLAECALRLGNLAEARRICETLLTETTNEFFCLVKLGQIHAQTGNRREAIICLEKALRQQPNHRAVRQQLAVQLQNAGDTARASNLLAGLNATDRPKPLERPDPWREAVAGLNQSSEMNNIRGNEALRAGRYRLAAGWYAVGLKSNPTNVLVAANLGQALLALDEVTEARRVLETAYQLRPDYETLTQQLSVARARAGATNEALSLALDWGRRHTNDATAIQMEADVRAALRDYAGAEAATRRALEVKPSDVSLHVAAGAYTAALGKSQAALASFEESLKTLGDRAEIQHNLARLLLTSTDDLVRAPRRALPLVQSLVASHATVPRWETLALALDQTGDSEQALAVIRRAVTALGEDGSAALRRRVMRVQAAIEAKRAFRESWPFADE